MKTKETIILGLALFIGLLLGQRYLVDPGQTESVEQTTDTGTHYKRINLVVSDLDKSLTIYKDILGFTVHKISESSSESYLYPVFRFPKEAKLKFCTMDSPDQIRTMALTEVKGIHLPEPSVIKTSGSVIRVKDLPGIMNKIKALGLEYTDSKVAEDTNKEFSFTEQSFVDYDGHLIVIYELIKE